MTHPYLNVILEQTAPAWANVAPNRENIEGLAHQHGDADLLVTPELSLTGYDLGERVQDLARALDGAPPLKLPAEGPAVVFGMVERGRDHLAYNSAVVQRGERVLAIQRKRYLPTYGLFDEGRFFAPGRGTPRAFDLTPEWRVGVLVCEDLWHPMLPYLMALQGADVLVVPSAAPGRGSPAPASPPYRRFRSHERWEVLTRATAICHGVYVLLCNRAGVEGELEFAGGSMVVGPDGEVSARAPEGEAATLEVRLDPGAVTRARHPFSHLRDEDPHHALRALERIVRDSP